MDSPLLGLKVVELATILAGPAVGMFLAEMGAEVLKVEPPGGDPTRGWKVPGEIASDGLSTYFCAVNWGKRSICLDLKQSQARLQLDHHLAEADILLLNFRPGQAESYGLAWSHLKERFPRLIVASVSGYGSDNSRPGFDALIQAESGLMDLNGEAQGPPCKLPVAFVDLLAAHQLKEAILLALLLRERNGQGQWVEVSLWDAALSSLANQASAFLMQGYRAQRMGSEHPSLFPYGTILGDVLVAVGTDRQFAALCEVLAAPELAERYARNAQRVAHREQLRSLLQERARHRADLLEALQLAGVPAGKVQTLEQALSEYPHTLSHGPLGAVRSVAFTHRPRPLLPPPAWKGV